MPRISHYCSRFIYRYTTRLRAGARRPPRPDYLSLACRALEAFYKLDQSLGPCIREQCRNQENQAFLEEVEAALRHVYGPDYKSQTPPVHNHQEQQVPKIPQRANSSDKITNSIKKR